MSTHSRDGGGDGDASLRRKVLTGGAFLIARQSAGIAINTIGLFLLLWAIGPSEYGLFMAAVSFNSTLSTVAKSGIQVYLVRRPDPMDPRDFHQAFTLFLTTGTVGTITAILLLPLLSSWVGMEGFRPVALGLFAGLPLALLAIVPTVHLERALDYRRIASIEFLAQLVYQGITLTLAFRGFGAFAPVSGWWGQYLFSVIALFLVSGYRPRLVFDRARIRQMVSYGIGYSSSQWLWKWRNLVNPMIVGPALGPAAVGYVALAGRMCDLLTFVKDIGARLSVSALARVQTDRERMRRALSEGIQLQILTIGPFLAAFAIAAPVILPYLPGERASEWAPALEVFPFLALAYLAHGIFNLQRSALYVLGRNSAVGIFHAANLALFAGVAWTLVPRFGIIAVGIADVASAALYVMIHVRTRAYVGRVEYGPVWVWAIGFGVAVFWSHLGWISLLGLALVGVWPQTWTVLRRYYLEIRREMELRREPHNSSPIPVAGTRSS